MSCSKGLLWLGGVVLYERATRSRKRAGSLAMYIGVAILTWLWIGSLSGVAPQVSILQMGIIDVIFLSIVVSWACWVDKLRAATGEASEPPSALGGLMPGQMPGQNVGMSGAVPGYWRKQRLALIEKWSCPPSSKP